MVVLWSDVFIIGPMLCFHNVQAGNAIHIPATGWCWEEEEDYKRAMSVLHCVHLAGHGNNTLHSEQCGIS